MVDFEGGSYSAPHFLAAASGSIAAAAAELRRGATTSARLVQDCLEAVERRDPGLRAVVHLMADEAGGQAAGLDTELAAGRDRGPLHGIPMTVKDIIDVAGAPTRAGSAVYEQVPRVDAEAVARLRAAGAVIIAKVSTHEFALGVTTPQSRNPHDPAIIVVAASWFSPLRSPAVPKSRITACSSRAPGSVRIRFSGLRSR